MANRESRFIVDLGLSEIWNLCVEIQLKPFVSVELQNRFQGIDMVCSIER